MRDIVFNVLHDFFLIRDITSKPYYGYSTLFLLFKLPTEKCDKLRNITEKIILRENRDLSLDQLTDYWIDEIESYHKTRED